MLSNACVCEEGSFDMKFVIKASDGILSRSAGGNAADAMFGTMQIHSMTSEA